mmetsp:Transcript_37752/g.43119  ORF Transcript_37752/g.43119 Transcript_37752/m.43119 type:complete len:165 (-) Transcript_37752:98-592(-)
MVEGLLVLAGEVLGGDLELLGILVEHDVLDHGVAADPLVVDLGVLGVAHDVVAEGEAGWVRAGGLAVVLLEGVVGKLEALLWPVRPQVLVHAVVAGVAVLVNAGPPVVIPETADLLLALENDDLGAFLSLVLELLEGSDSGDAGWASSNDCDSHVKIQYKSRCV